MRFFILLLLFSSILYAEEKSIFILNTSDIHSKLEDYEDEFGRISNFLRLASSLKNRANELGRERVILIDCGDIIQGSLPAVISSGEIGFIFLEHCSYDFLVPGNHDFDFGFERFNELTKKFPSINIIALNLKLNNSKKWMMINKSGINIAVIGVPLPYIKFFNMAADDFKEGEIEDELDKIIPEIMNAVPSAIILAIHHGIFSPSARGGIDLEKIARLYPQINLFLGGHSHEENPGQMIGPSSWFVQAGSHAKLYSEIEIVFSEEKNFFKLKDIKSKLVDVNAESEKDNELKNKISPSLSQASKKGAELIGYTNKLIPDADENIFDCEIRELISSALCSAAGTKFAFSSSGTRLANFSREITYADLYRLLPFEDTVCTLKLNFEEFSQILQEQLSKTDTRHAIYPWGLICELDENKKILNIKMPNDLFFDKDKKFEFAFSSFALYGAGGRFPKLAEIAKKSDCEFRNTNIKVRDALCEYIKKNSPLNIKKTEWVKVKLNTN